MQLERISALIVEQGFQIVEIGYGESQVELFGVVDAILSYRLQTEQRGVLVVLSELLSLFDGRNGKVAYTAVVQGVHSLVAVAVSVALYDADVRAVFAVFFGQSFCVVS